MTKYLKYPLVAFGVLVLLLAFPPVLSRAAFGVTRLSDAVRGDAYESRTFDSDGVLIRYIEVGAGEPVILAHGFAWSVEPHWVATGMVQAIVDSGFRVIAYDARGHGRSEKPSDPAAYGEAMVDDVVRLMDHLEIERAHYVGYSMGAHVGQALRHAHPERVRSLVLGGFGSGGDGVQAQVPEDVRAALGGGDLGPLVRLLIPPERLPSRWAIAIMSGMFDARNDLVTLADALPGILSLRLPTAAELATNAVPTMAIIGAADGNVAGVGAMAAVMPMLEVRMIPDADHATAIAHPALATGVTAFLSAHRSPE